MTAPASIPSSAGGYLFVEDEVGLGRALVGLPRCLFQIAQRRTYDADPTNDKGLHAHLTTHLPPRSVLQTACQLNASQVEDVTPSRCSGEIDALSIWVRIGHACGMEQKHGWDRLVERPSPTRGPLPPK